MAEVREEEEVNARILYWGIPGAGISSNLHSIHDKLKASNRGDIRTVPTRIDPTVEYEVLPIKIGKVNGIDTRFDIIGTPSTSEQAPTRKHLLDRVDGIVFVVDSRPECLQENQRSLEELRSSLSDYGYRTEQLPFVVQYNKCDLVDPFAIEELHRRLDVQGAAVFEASAVAGTGVLKTLTTISKNVVRVLGNRQQEAAAAPAAPEPVAAVEVAPEVVEVAEANAVEIEPAPSEVIAAVEAEPPARPTTATEVMEAAILAEADDELEAHAAEETALHAQAQLDRSWQEHEQEAKTAGSMRIGPDMRIVSIGVGEKLGARSIRIPLVLGNDEGETTTLALTLQLDPLLDDAS